MKTKNDYFVNHYRSTQFPFSLYHQPITNSLKQFLETIAAKKKNAEVLIIGGGLIHELSHIPAYLQLTIIDIDQRIIAEIEKLNNPRIKEIKLVRVEDTPTKLNKKFDAIYAKEVIEHIIPWQYYLNEIKASLVPGGRIWLSTPNYGDLWLPLLENTILEVIARSTGYSRKNIHPSRFSSNLLSLGLQRAGFNNVEVKKVSFRLALVATATNEMGLKKWL